MQYDGTRAIQRISILHKRSSSRHGLAVYTICSVWKLSVYALASGVLDSQH
jgi:hypothetical protein